MSKTMTYVRQLTTVAIISSSLLPCFAFQTPVSSFLSIHHQHQKITNTNNDNSKLYSSMSGGADESLDEVKSKLVNLCSSSSPSKQSVQGMVTALEERAELDGVGQASSHSGLLSGEWELIYAPEDITRSSPFFWAFRRAFPDQSDQIFSITDSIPAPIKEVGPATQTIDMDAKTFISRVKVATLGGLATSIMTTRATILGVEGLEGIRLRVDTTKPEESTVLKKLGPLGDLVNENSKPFPSGDALERVTPGSSEVVMKTTFCDEGLRISRNEDKVNDVYVWKRTGFLGGVDV